LFPAAYVVLIRPIKLFTPALTDAPRVFGPSNGGAIVAGYGTLMRVGAKVVVNKDMNASDMLGKVVPPTTNAACAARVGATKVSVVPVGAAVAADGVPRIVTAVRAAVVMRTEGSRK